jgi:hypothetical protein
MTLQVPVRSLYVILYSRSSLVVGLAMANRLSCVEDLLSSGQALDNSPFQEVAISFGHVSISLIVVSFRQFCRAA